jgi:hypothetical protein
MLDWLDRFARRPYLLLAAGAFSVLAVWGQASSYRFTPDRVVDSYSYYFAAQALEKGLNPYDGALLEALGDKEQLSPNLPEERRSPIYPYVYPPPFAGFWRAFLFLSPLQAHRVVVAADSLLVGVILYLLAKSVSITHHRHAFLLAIVLFQAVNGPAITSARLGQISPGILALLVGTLLLLFRRREALSALCLASAVLIKILPMLLVLWLPFYSRRREYLGWMALWATAIVGISLLLAPPLSWLQFVDSAITGPAASGPALESDLSIWGWLTIHGRGNQVIRGGRVWLYLLTAVPLLLLTLNSIRNTVEAERPGSVVKVVEK